MYCNGKALQKAARLGYSYEPCWRMSCNIENPLGLYVVLNKWWHHLTQAFTHILVVILLNYIYMTSCNVNFVNISHMVMQLPGVDPNDPSVRDVLASLEAEEEVSLCRPLIWDNSDLCCSLSHLLNSGVWHPFCSSSLLLLFVGLTSKCGDVAML